MWVLVRTASVRRFLRIHTIYLLVGFKGLFIVRTRFPDDQKVWNCGVRKVRDRTKGKRNYEITQFISFFFFFFFLLKKAVVTCKH